MAKKTPFDCLFMDCEVPSMITRLKFEDMAMPGYRNPYPAFKGRDSSGARFIYCRRPMRVEFNDGHVTDGVLPIVLYQRIGSPLIGMYMVTNQPWIGKLAIQSCNDVSKFIHEFTLAMVGDKVTVKTDVAMVEINHVDSRDPKVGRLITWDLPPSVGA